MEMNKVAVVTGGSRGIGFEVCRLLGKAGFHIVSVSKNKIVGLKALQDLQTMGVSCDYYHMDVSDEASVRMFGAWVASKFPKVDVLVNDAGIFLDTEDNLSLSEVPISRVQKTMEVNLFGPIYLVRSLLPSLKLAGKSQVINLSSGLGQLSDMHGGYPAYRLSKLAINGVTRIFAGELAHDGILVNSVCPGWCRTDMGSPEAPRTAAEGADTIVWLATSEHEFTGKFFRDRKEIDW